MPTNFPSGLDNFTNPTAADNLNSVTVPHADQHANENDAIEALEAKVGIDGSLVTGSLDYRVSTLEGQSGHSPVTLGIANGLVLSGQTLSMNLAGANSTGTLSAQDWNTFNNKQSSLTLPLASSLGGTSVSNTGTFTNHSNTIIVGGGTISLGGFALTVPATGTVALLATTNVFTIQQMVDGTSDQVQLRVQANATQTSHLQDWENSSGTPLAWVTGGGLIRVGYDAPTGLETAGFYTGIDTEIGFFAAGHFSNTAARSSLFYFLRGRGTHGSKSAASNGDVIGAIRFAEWNGTSLNTIGAIKHTKNIGMQLSGSGDTNFYMLVDAGGRGVSIGQNLTATSPAALLVESIFNALPVVAFRNKATHTGTMTEWRNSSDAVQMAIANNGRDWILDTTTGTKIGTATSQKLSLWNKTPDVQPTNAITAAAFVANTSGIVDDSATFGGYTIGQIAAALIRLGALA